MVSKQLQHERLVRGIAKGAGVVFAATIIARIFGYFIRALIARGYGPEGYGMISTSLAVMVMASRIALMGLTNSVSRQIPFYIGKGKHANVRSLIFSAYFISTLIASVLAFLLYRYSDLIAVSVFKNEQLIPFFRYFSFTLVVYIFIELSASVFKAYKKMVYYVLVKDLLRFAAIFLAVLAVTVLNGPVRYLGLAYLGAHLAIGLLGTSGLFTLTPISTYKSSGLFKEFSTLFSFSWPLMMASIAYMLLYKVDILMIGYFLNQSEVGIYNAAVPIAQLLTIIISSFTPFLLPSMTEYYAGSDITNLDKTFSISTKWIFLLTIPLFSLIFFFPEFFLVVIFGKQFVEAAPVLRIISLGFLLASSVGPTGNLLIVLGRTRLMLLNNTAIFLLNIILNYLLIPLYGIIGSAIASAVSLITLNALTLIEIYRIVEIQPFTRYFIKICMLSIGLAAIMRMVFTPQSFLIGAAYFMFYGGVFMLGLKYTGCFDENDQIVFVEIEKRMMNVKDWFDGFIH